MGSSVSLDGYAVTREKEEAIYSLRKTLPVTLLVVPGLVPIYLGQENGEPIIMPIPGVVDDLDTIGARKRSLGVRLVGIYPTI